MAFEEYLDMLGERRDAAAYYTERTSADGPEVFLVVDEKPTELKRIGIEMEENHILGRFFDIDV